jgi:nitronate monooxygenase
MFKTRITEIFGIKYPIIQGALGYLSRAELVSAVSNAGGLGSLATAGISTITELREEIRKTKSLTDKPFAVNFTFLPGRVINHEETRDIIIEEGVPVVETIAVGKIPEHILKPLKENGVKRIHKCTRVRHAMSAETEGADAVAILGFGADGHPGLDEITHMAQIPKAAESLRIPVIMAGGIADARGFLAALSLGAEGVLMGTRFLTAKECPIHSNIRERLLQAQETDTVLVDATHGLPSRALKNKNALEILELEKKGASLEEILKLRSGERAAKAWKEGDIDGGSFGCGQVIGIIHEILTVKEIIEGIINEANAIIERLCSLAKA